MKPKQLVSYRLRVEAVKALRRYERQHKLEKNLSKTILSLLEQLTNK
jgi:hypothetical protein